MLITEISTLSRDRKNWNLDFGIRNRNVLERRKQSKSATRKMRDDNSEKIDEKIRGDVERSREQNCERDAKIGGNVERSRGRRIVRVDRVYWD